MKEKIRINGWIVFSIVSAILACFILVGSYFLIKNTQDVVTPPAPGQITARILEQMGYQDYLEVEAPQLSRHYDIPPEVISDFSLYINRSGENPSELACFLLREESDYTALQAAVSNHMKAKAAAYQTLNPAQYEIIQKYTIKQNGKYVLVSVGNNAESDIKIFNNMTR